MREFEVFLKKAGKEEFRHAGALQAPDAELALMYAREAYSRRGEGAEMWLVDRTDLIVGTPETLADTADKPHRHNDGSAVAARRKAQRSEQQQPDASRAEAPS